MTVANIAKLAKVSTATVSRAINRVPTVDPVLARRVWRVIERVGYYPNTQARALVSGRSRIFGLVVSEIRNSFFPEIVETFTQLAVKHKYEILLTSTGSDSNQVEIAARRMVERRVDGVAILTFGLGDSLVDLFRKRNVPVFAIDTDSPRSLLATVRIDHEHGVRQAVQHLAALGHVHIAFVSGPEHLKMAIARKIAFEKCMNEIRLETHPKLLVQGDHTMEAGMKAMSALAALPNRPTSVICSNDLTAIGVMRQAFELSLDVPRDLSVVGFDDIRMAQFLIPPLTTVQTSVAEVAEAAFAALLESVERERTRSSRKPAVIKTNLVLRHSTALAPDRRLRTDTGTDNPARTELRRQGSEFSPVFT